MPEKPRIRVSEAPQSHRGQPVVCLVYSVAVSSQSTHPIMLWPCCESNLDAAVSWRDSKDNQVWFAVHNAINLLLLVRPQNIFSRHCRRTIAAASPLAVPALVVMHPMPQGFVLRAVVGYKNVHGLCSTAQHKSCRLNMSTT